MRRSTLKIKQSKQSSIVALLITYELKSKTFKFYANFYGRNKICEANSMYVLCKEILITK